MQNAACYLRVSRADQRSALQHDETSRLVESRRWKLHRVFADDGISGATDKRPAFREMMAAARRRDFDVLVVYRSDRLFRSLAELVTTIDELAALGVGFVSTTEPFDTTTPSGRLLLQVVGAFAEFERNVLRERTRDGLAAARRRGVQLGRPRATLDIAAGEALKARGATLREIVAELGGSAATWSVALRNVASSTRDSSVDAFGKRPRNRDS